jgi:hypothetical protein
MFGAIGRVFVVGFAFLAAIVGAIVIVFQLGLERVTHVLHGDSDPVMTVFDLVMLGLDVSFFLMLVLAILVVVTGEVARIRSVLFYIAGWGLAAAAAPLLLEAQRSSGAATLPAFVWQVFATAGFVGGAIYWFIAGRTA